MKVMGIVFVFSKLYYQKKNSPRCNSESIPSSGSLCTVFLYSKDKYCQWGMVQIRYVPIPINPSTGGQRTCEIYIWGSQLMIPGAI
jgi:hypothetical protein